MSRPFVARYGGICGACTERFAGGDTVRFVDDEVCHDNCSERTVQGRAEMVCMSCFLTACDCGSDA